LVGCTPSAETRSWPKLIPAGLRGLAGRRGYPARRRIAGWLVEIGYFVVGAGMRLDRGRHAKPNPGRASASSAMTERLESVATFDARHMRKGAAE